MSPAPLSEAHRALARFLVADASIGDTLQRVAEITVAAIPSAQYLGVSMLNERGQATTAIFTDHQSPEIDASQYDEGVGPCLDAWRQKRVVRVPDMREAVEQYPKFARTALGYGVLSTLSLPVVVGSEGVGAFNMYATAAHAFSPEEEAVATELTTTAAVVMANSQAYWQALELAEGLKAAMKSRAVIEQAKGMLMAQDEHLSPDDAFEMLKKASQCENVKLREIAQRMVDRLPASNS